MSARRRREVWRTDSAAEAGLVRMILERAGIATESDGEGLTALAGGLPMQDASVCVRVMDEARLGEALELLEGFQRARREGVVGREPRRCAACGETSPATFDLCWSCGGELANSAEGELE